MGGALSFVAALATGWSGVSRVLVLSGLVVGVVEVLRFLFGSRALRLPVTSAVRVDGVKSALRAFAIGSRGAFLWPFSLVWLGFWLGSQAQNVVWATLVMALVVALVADAVRWLRAAHARRGDAEVAPVVLAVVLSCGLLVQFGSLLVVRLVIAPVPGEYLVDGVTTDALEEAVTAIAFPIVALLLLVNAPRLWRRAPRRVRDRGAAAARGAVGLAARVAPRWWTPLLRRRRREFEIGMVFVVFAIAYIGDPDHLKFLGVVATAEYGKILYVWLLAGMLAGFAHRFGRNDLVLRDRGHLRFPVALFLAVGFASLVKSDLGPLIGLLAVTVGLMLLLVRDGASRTADQRGLGRWERLVRLVGHTRWYLLVLVVVLVAGGLFIALIPKVEARFDAMTHPWQYAWTPSCTPAEVTVAGVPQGTRACRSLVGTGEANTRSQVAHGMAVIADGGLWGRGLTDSGSGALPLGSSDFVVAVIWGKAGAVGVLLLAVLLALLATALARTAREITWPGAPPGPSRARLFAAGMALLLVAQFGYIFLATVGFVPHSGVTAPFLSRGGQSTLALTAGVAVALWAAYRPPPAPRTPAAVTPPRSRAARVRRFPVAATAVLVVCAFFASIVTAYPYRGYAEDRPFCLGAKPVVDPTTCSTDQVAMRRTSVLLTIGGVPQYRRNRGKGEWEPVGDPSIGLEDLAGLVQVGDTAGAVDGALRPLVQGSTGLSDRLLPPPPDGPEPGVVELTLDPAVQSAAASALRADAEGAGPLAGGIVVLEAATGRVLAAASAPGAHLPPEADPEADPPADPAPIAATVTEQFAEQHPAGRLGEDGSIDESRPAECAQAPISSDRCWKWALEREPAPEPAESTADRRRYVDNRTDVGLPPLDDNRALGHNYGLGSTFKIVVAAAYLRGPGTSVEDELPSPAAFETPAGTRYNHDKGVCQGTEDGRITLAEALAVSCNTAFLSLAEELGWPAIRDTAVDFGFTVGPTDGPRGPAPVAGLDLGIDSRVPRDATSSSLAVNVLGGGQVDGTPLQMASVVAAVANGGTLVRPSLVAATTAPHGGVRVPVDAEVRQVLTPDQAALLSTGLEGTVRPGGTAAKLPAHAGHTLRVKTGTHELPGGEDPAVQPFASQIAWMVGTVDTRAGPVAFAVAVETADEARGASRARWLADEVITRITEVRG